MLKAPAQLSSVSTTLFAGLLVLFASAPAVAASSCGNLKGCERKFCEIETQLNIAQKNGNKHKANGLKRSLEGAKAHCTDKGLRAELVEDIDEAKKDIAEYQADLKEAEEDGKSDKIRKYQGKIEEQRREIKHLEDELSGLD